MTSGGSKEEFEALTAKIREAQFRNYTSFEEEPDLARGEIQRCIDAEHMTEFRTLEEVQEYVGGKPLLNQLALQVKTKADGSLKLRLITDLLRSQGSWFLWAPERIVLPRLVDAVESAR